MTPFHSSVVLSFSWWGGENRRAQCKTSIQSVSQQMCPGGFPGGTLKYAQAAVMLLQNLRCASARDTLEWIVVGPCEDVDREMYHFHRIWSCEDPQSPAEWDQRSIYSSILFHTSQAGGLEKLLNRARGPSPTDAPALPATGGQKTQNIGTVQITALDGPDFHEFGFKPSLTVGYHQVRFGWVISLNDWIS